MPEEKIPQFEALAQRLGESKGLYNLPFISGSDLPIEMRWIVALLYRTAAEVNQALENFRFDEAANAIYQFFWGSFCDWYLEIVKLRLDFSPVVPAEELATREATEEEGKAWERRGIATMSLFNLLTVFETCFACSPFMPFITEELWHAVYDGEPPAKSIALAIFPKPRETSDLPVPIIEEMALLQGLITEIRGLRKEVGVEEKALIPVEVRAHSTLKKLAEDNRDIIEKLARVSEVRFVDAITDGLSKHSTPAFDVAVIYERTIDIPAERERLTKDIVRYEKGLTSAERQLGNEAFLAKAPSNVVEGLKKNEAEMRQLLEKARAALNALPRD